MDRRKPTLLIFKGQVRCIESSEVFEKRLVIDGDDVDDWCILGRPGIIYCRFDPGVVQERHTAPVKRLRWLWSHDSSEGGRTAAAEAYLQVTPCFLVLYTIKSHRTLRCL